MVIALLSLGVWVKVLMVKLDKANNNQEQYWREKYEIAQDSIEVIAQEREILRKSRIYLDSMRIYWQGQYNSKDSTLNRIKSHYNEGIANIRSANATERNQLLSNRLRQIADYRY